MVVFTCSECGQSVKKNQVEKHCSQCRGCQSLSCMDCGKDFWGDDYKEHTACISEDQKYGGKDYKPKSGNNKGLVKQELWIEHIKNTISSKKLSGPLSALLEQVIGYTNIPRKQSKFENFLRNSVRVRNPHLIRGAWEIFAQSTANESNVSANGINATNSKKVDVNHAVKRKLEDAEEKSSKMPCIAATTDLTNGLKPNTINGSTKKESSKRKFHFARCIKRILTNSESTPMPVRKLKKQVLAEYMVFSGDSSQSKKEEVKAKLLKILGNDRKYVINYKENS